MYYTLGFRRNIESCIKLISSKEKNKFNSLLELKLALGRFVDQIQPESKISLEPEALPKLITSRNQKLILAEAFTVKSHLNDLGQSSMIENIEFESEQKYAENLYSAIHVIENQNPDLANLIKIVFRYLLFGKSSKAHGGSTSNALGVLWLNPSEKWTLQDYCEFLVHELTHQLLFLDERVFGHYTQYSEISHKENFAFSTILKKFRPLDKVIHSYFVGQNVLLYRDAHWTNNDSKFHLHPTSDHLKKGLEDTLQSLKQNHWTLMTSRIDDLIQTEPRNPTSKSA